MWSPSISNQLCQSIYTRIIYFYTRCTIIQQQKILRTANCLLTSPRTCMYIGRSYWTCHPWPSFVQYMIWSGGPLEFLIRLPSPILCGIYPTRPSFCFSYFFAARSPDHIKDNVQMAFGSNSKELESCPTVLRTLIPHKQKCCELEFCRQMSSFIILRTVSAKL